MSRSRMAVVAALAAVSVFSSVFPASHAVAQAWTPPANIAASSSAAALNVELTVSGKTGSLVNQVFASGATNAAYDKTTKMPSYTKTAGLAGGMSVSATAKTLTSKAWAPATAGGARTSHGSTTIGSLTEKLLNGKTVVLTITGTDLTSGATFAKNSKGAIRPAGTMSVGTVTINAPTWGIKNVSHKGSAKANTVLFKTVDGSLVIYANYQVETAAFGSATSIMVDTIDIHMTKFKSGAKILTGDIQVGTSIAK
jgi:hypothetical protein